MASPLVDAQPAKGGREPPELVRQYLDAYRQKRTLKAQLKDVEEQLSQLENQVVEQVFAPLGARSLRFDDATLSIREDIRVSGGGDREAAVEALKEEGWDYLVKENFHSGQVAAFVREKLAETEEQLGDEILNLTFEELVERALGPVLAQHLSVNKVPSLSVTNR